MSDQAAITYKRATYKGHQGVMIENSEFGIHVAGANPRHVRIVYNKSESFAYKIKRALAKLNMLMDIDIASEMTFGEVMEMINKKLDEKEIEKELREI